MKTHEEMKRNQVVFIKEHILAKNYRMRIM